MESPELSKDTTQHWHQALTRCRCRMLELLMYLRQNSQMYSIGRLHACHSANIKNTHQMMHSLRPVFRFPTNASEALHTALCKYKYNNNNRQNCYKQCPHPPKRRRRFRIDLGPLRGSSSPSQRFEPARAKPVRWFYLPAGSHPLQY